MAVLKLQTKLNALLSKESIEDSDYKTYVKTLNTLTQSIQRKSWFPNYAPIVKNWISEFETIFNPNKMKEDHQMLDRLCTAITEVFLKLLRSFHQFEPKYTQEFYSHWKSVIVRINESKRASSFIRHISHFKVVIEHLRTAYHRCEQLAILSVLKLYIEKVPSDKLKKLKIHDNSDIIDKLIELMKNPTIMDQNVFLHGINAMGHCIVTMEATEIVCDKLRMQYNSSEHKMWVDFNLKDKSVIFVTISLTNTEYRSLAVGCHIKMRENEENMIEINGTWNFLTNNKDSFKKIVTIKVFLANLIPELVKNGFHFVHSAFVGSISQGLSIPEVMIEREPSPKDAIDDSNIETESKRSEMDDSSISSMVPTINTARNRKLLTQTAQEEMEIANSDDIQSLLNAGTNIFKKIDIIGDERLTGRSSSHALNKSVIPIAENQLESDRNMEDVFEKGEEVTPIERINESIKKSTNDKGADKLFVNKARTSDDDRDFDILLRDDLSVSEERNYDDSESQSGTNESENFYGFPKSAWKDFGRAVRLTKERLLNETLGIPTQQNESFLNFESTVQNVTRTRTVKYMHSSQVEMDRSTKQIRHLDLYSQPTTSRERCSTKASQMEQIAPKRNENVSVQELPLEKSPIEFSPRKNHSRNRNEMINQSIEPVRDSQKSLITTEQQNHSQNKKKFFNRSKEMSQAPPIQTEQQNVSQNKNSFFNRSIEMPQVPRIQGVSRNPYEMFSSQAPSTEANRQLFTQQPVENVQVCDETASTHHSQNIANSQARNKSQDQTENFASLPLPITTAVSSNRSSHGNSSLVRLPEETTKTAPAKAKKKSKKRSKLPSVSRRVTRKTAKQSANTFVPPMTKPCENASSSPKNLKKLLVLPTLNQNLSQNQMVESVTPTTIQDFQERSNLAAPLNRTAGNSTKQPSKGNKYVPSMMNSSQIDMELTPQHVGHQDIYSQPTTSRERFLIKDSPFDLITPKQFFVDTSPMKNHSQNRNEMIVQSIEPIQDHRNRSMTPEPQIASQKESTFFNRSNDKPLRPQTQEISQIPYEMFKPQVTSTQNNRQRFSQRQSENESVFGDTPASTQQTRYTVNSQTWNSPADQTENFVSLPVASQTSQEKSTSLHLQEETTKTAPVKAKKDSKDTSNLPIVSRPVTRKSTKQLSKGGIYVPPIRTIQPPEKVSSSPTRNSSTNLKKSFAMPSSIKKLSENKIVESVVPPTKAIQDSEERLNLATTGISTKPKAPKVSFHLPTPSSNHNLYQHRIVESVIPPVIATQPSQKPSTSKQQTVNDESFVQPSITPQKMSTALSRVPAKKLLSKKFLKRKTIKPRKTIKSKAQNSMKNHTESFVPEDDQMDNDEMSNWAGRTSESVQDPKSLRREHPIESFVPEDVLPEKTGQRLETRNNSWKVESWIESLPTHSTQNTSKSVTSQDISTRKSVQVPQERSFITTGLTNDEPFQGFDGAYSTSNNRDDEPFDIPNHNEADTSDNIRIDEAGMISDDKGCVFANNDELQQAANFFIEKDGLAYMKTRAFLAWNVKTREKIERQFRTIHTMMNRGLNNLHRDNGDTPDEDPYTPGYAEYVCKSFKKTKLKRRLTEEMSFTVSKQNTRGRTANTEKVSFAITHRRISKVYQVHDDDTTSTSTFARQRPPKRQNSSPIPTNEKKFFKKTKFSHVKEPSHKKGVSSKSKVNLSTTKSPGVKPPMCASEKQKALHREREMSYATEDRRDVDMECADPILDDTMELSNENRIEKLPIYATEKLKTAIRKPKISSSTDLFVYRNNRKVDEPSTNAPIDDVPDEYQVEEQPSKRMKTASREGMIFTSKIDPPRVDNAMDAFNKSRINTSGRLNTTNRKQKISSSIDARPDPSLADIDFPDPNVGDVGNFPSTPSTSNAINGNKICNVVKCDAIMKDAIRTINVSLKDPVEICTAHIRTMTGFIQSLQVVDLQRDSVISGLSDIVNAVMASIQLICDNAIAQCYRDKN